MNKLYSIFVAFLIFFNLSLFAQDGPPWDFNGTDNGFVAQNYASLTVGDTYVTFTLNDADGDGDAESPNSNFRNLDAGIDTSLGGFIAITMKNETANNKMQAILGSPGAGCGCYVNFETLTANDADFVTHYINVGANSNWTGTISEIIFRFKKGNGINNQTFAGDILIDHIEIVESIPATPRVDYTFDDTSDSEGFSGVNGITLTQPVAGELHLDIAAQSPYPKLEQTGLYSVDADTYKYAQVTLVNNSPKNKLTLVSPSGGNEYSTTDMVANDGVVQTYELDLTELTNWNGTQANWWLQLVENPGDGVVASAGIIDIQQILFATESINPPASGCDLTVNMTDDYGDGWGTGNFLDIYVNGELSQSGLTVDATTNSTTVSASYGDIVLFDMTAGGSWTSEMILEVVDADGVTVVSTTAGNDATFECLDPNAINLSVSATTDGGSATFSFDIANFTVGAAAGEGDGHIHYSLNGGDEVMVYSTDDLTLSDLPNGDHTIVFSLVDANHAPLDPAVEATVEFSTFDGTAACDETVTYTQVANGDYTISMTAPEGQVASVTVNGNVENGWDFLYVNDGAGTPLNSDQNTGIFEDATFTSTTGTVSVSIVNDGSIQNGDVTLAFSCAVQQTAVTFNVDMSQYGLADGDTVHVNGEFTGWCGDCGYNVMSDDDGDGIYSLTLQLDPGSYFWKYTVNGWNAQEGFSEAIDGCTADNNGNFDRQVVVGAEALELSYCWNSCEAAGSCSPIEPILMPIDHENESVNYAWNDFGGAATSVIANPDASGINTSANVAQSIKTAGSETWAGTFIVLDEQLDFSEVTTLAVDVWTPDGGELVNLKVENSADSYAIEINQPTTVAAGWETLYYDLSGGDLSLVYNKLVFFFDFNVAGDDTAYYFDNIRLEAAAEACIPGPMDCSLGDGFVGLVMADIDNSDSGCSTDGYGDFTELSTELAQGQTVPVTITTGYINQYIKAWVDFNDDLVFGTDEVVIDNVLIAATGTIDVDAVIPAEAALGAHVMRFKANWNTEVPEDACEATTYGEVEDYTVVIVEAGLSIDEVDSLDMRIYPNPVDGNYVTIQSPIQGLIEVEVYTVTGRKLLQTVLTDDKLDVSSFNSGFYMVKVTINGQSKLSKLVVR